MLNHITIMGRLTRDPELRQTGSQISVASFSVAVDRDFPDKTTGQRETDFLDCVAWRQTGEFVSRNFKKGSMICVSGRLQIRSWTDKDGNKRKTAEIVADNVYFAGSRNEGNATPASPSALPETEAMLSAYGVKPASDFAMINDSDDQLPF